MFNCAGIARKLYSHVSKRPERSLKTDCKTDMEYDF